MPYKTPLTFTYDSGTFRGEHEPGDEARRLGGLRSAAQGIGQARHAARHRLSNTIEQAADPTIETAEIRFDPLGGMTFVSGSISPRPGPCDDPDRRSWWIAWASIRIRVQVHPGRHLTPVAFGMGTGGSRSTTMSGGAIVLVADKVIAKGQEARGHILEAAEGDIEFKDGRFTIAGTDRAMGIHELATAAFQLEKLPAGMEPGLYETATYRAHSGNFPNGCHVCEVEIDPQTGSTQLVGYWVVDDVGTVINPMLLKGQIMGGIAQGMGQVLMEDKCYDAAGQVVAGSFMDYAMPRADNFCAVVIEDNPVPTPTNPLGVKGAGEAGTVGSLSAGVNAIVDALSVYGIRHIDTPCTPFKVWQAIEQAKRRALKRPPPVQTALSRSHADRFAVHERIMARCEFTQLGADHVGPRRHGAVIDQRLDCAGFEPRAWQVGMNQASNAGPLDRLSIEMVFDMLRQQQLRHPGRQRIRRKAGAAKMDDQPALSQDTGDRLAA
jgi:carbon-monoxide dehydrogenase large subunit